MFEYSCIHVCSQWSVHILNSPRGSYGEAGYRCVEGYRFLDEAENLYCTSNGDWGVTMPECKPEGGGACYRVVEQVKPFRLMLNGRVSTLL